MKYPSLLYTSGPSGRQVNPEVFEDLKLDLLLGQNAIEAMRTLCRPEDIPVRQELFKALDDAENLDRLRILSMGASQISRLCEAYAAVRCDNERHYVYFNLANAVISFYENAAKINGTGFLLGRFRDFFEKEVSSAYFKKLRDEAKRLVPGSEKVRVNSFRMVGEQLYIRPEESTTIVSRLLKCAADLGLKNKPVEQREVSIRLNPRIINALAGLHRDFAAFKGFYDEYADFFSDEILKYLSELNFYLEINAIFKRVREAGIPVCWPSGSREKKISIKELRDLSLLAKNETNIVPNDIFFNEEEPFFFLTGANGGGKTTYLRSVGIAVLLFLSGCPIPCESAEIYPLDNVFTHFPRDERFEGEGRFADEEKRVNEILSAHGGNSLVLLNETYSTTSEDLAVKLTVELAKTLHKSGSLGIYITHQHGIGETDIPFLSVIIDQSMENRRTYKIARMRGISGSFARDILKKYSLTREALAERFLPKEASGR